MAVLSKFGKALLVWLLGRALVHVDRDEPRILPTGGSRCAQGPGAGTKL